MSHEPLDWLSSQVSQDGGAYRLVSPAGGVMELSDEQRRRIVACLRLCSRYSTDDLEKDQGLEVWQRGGW